jgi:cysteine desulfurase
MLHFPVYADYNATTPCDPRVLEAMLPYFSKNFGNPASNNHAFGWIAKEAIDQAREQIAKLIGAEPQEIIFTSGATEADNLALKGATETYRNKGNHIITGRTEHKAVLDSCKHLEKQGMEVTYLNVGADGLIDLNEFEKAIRPETIIVAIMYANNETGILQPVSEISRLAKQNGILFFSDATQAVGKIPVDVNKDGIDIMAFSSHKIYGPKGVGALYVRRKNPRVKLAAQIDGGGHERGLRSGTLNVPGIVGFGRACELCTEKMETDAGHLTTLRNKLENAILGFGGAHVNGNIGRRLPNIANIAFQHIDGNALLAGLTKEIAVSSGSACSSALPEPSHVLKAMGLDDELAHSSVRFSLGRFSTDEEVDYIIKKVADTVRNLRESSSVHKREKD